MSSAALKPLAVAPAVAKAVAGRDHNHGFFTHGF
jgi:hypothetical protein